MNKSARDYLNEICDLLEDACDNLSPTDFDYVIRRVKDEIEGYE